MDLILCSTTYDSNLIQSIECYITDNGLILLNYENTVFLIVGGIIILLITFFIVKSFFD